MNKTSQKQITSMIRQSEELKTIGEHQKAISILERVITEEPTCLKAIEEVSNNFLSIDETEKAEKSALYALVLDKKSYTANHVLGFLRLSKNEWDSAVEFLSIANRENPNSSEILRCLGWGLFHQGKKQEGIATLHRALSLDEQSPMILCDLAVCLMENEQITEARKHLENALKISPDNTRIMECLNVVDILEKGTE